MSKCAKHGEYHSDHGCGTAVGVGSSYAEHAMNCPQSPSFTGRGGLFKPNNGNQYPRWEAPAGNCPACWHKANPKAERTELSDFGEFAHESTKREYEK